MFVITFPFTGSILLVADGTMELDIRYVGGNQAQSCRVRLFVKILKPKALQYVVASITLIKFVQM